MTKVCDLTGQKFGRLQVLERGDNDRHAKARWKCRCICGEICIVTGQELRKGDTRSCGCLRQEARRAVARKDLRGQRIGKLVVLDLVPHPFGQGNVWLCICDCGKTKTLSSKDLDGTRYRSCGCGSGIPRLTNHEATVRLRFKAYRDNAKKKKRPFELSLEKFTNLVTSPCHYCGSITQRKQGRGARERGRNSEHYRPEYVNGVDRVSSSEGYTENNVVPCCSMCNKMKMEFPLDKWLQQIARIYLYQGGGGEKA